MQSYITKPKSVKRKEIVGREWSFSVNSYHSLSYKNKNTIKLEELKEEGFLGKNPKQVNFKTRHQMIKISSFDESSFTINYSEIANTEPFNYQLEKGNWIFFATRGVIIHKTTFLKIKENEKMIHSNNMYAMKVKDEYLFYLIAFLKSQLFIDYAKNSSPDGAVPAFLPNQILNFALPLPTQRNNPNPQAVQDLVSVLVQNIIDKEEQIKAKNAEIDRLIESELYGNQKKSGFVYSMPRISEIRQQGRLDTGLYTEEFKKIDNVIKGYVGGCFKLNAKNIRTGQTPDDYVYPNKKVNDNVYLWITPRNLNGNILKEKLFIHTKKDNTIQHGDILFGSRGTVGDIFFYDEQELGKCYINQSTSGIRIDGEIFNKVFVLCYFSGSIFKKIISKYIYDGTVPAITPDILTQFYIPLFPATLQQQIARLYYNKVEKNSNLTLENYLQKEKARNNEAGIFQLNMEIFTLREKLENLVHKIVMEEKIEVEFE